MSFKQIGADANRYLKRLQCVADAQGSVTGEPHKFEIEPPKEPDTADSPNAQLELAALLAEENIIPINERESKAVKQIQEIARRESHFFRVWGCSVLFVVKCCEYSPAHPFTVKMLFFMVLGAWNTAHPKEYFTPVRGYKLLAGFKRKNPAFYPFGKDDEDIHVLYFTLKYSGPTAGHSQHSQLSQPSQPSQLSQNDKDNTNHIVRDRRY